MFAWLLVFSGLVSAISSPSQAASEAVLGDDDEGTISPHPDATFEKYDELLRQHPKMEKALREHFASLDANGDHSLSMEELKTELTTREFHMTKQFDLDHDNTLSLQEYLRGPLLLHHLEARPSIADQFWKLADEAGVHGTVADVRPALAYAAGDKSNPSLIQVADGVSVDPSIVNKLKDMSDQELVRFLQVPPETAKDLVGLSRDDQLRFLQTKTNTKFLGALVGGIAKAGAKMLGVNTDDKKKVPGAPEPYKTQYGVPKIIDEGCVLCQYVSQMMQRALYVKLVDSPTGDIGDASPLKMKQTNEDVTNRPNGRGLARLVVEDTLTEFCDPNNLPELFYPHCKDFWSVQWVFTKCLFYQIPVQTWCIETQDCPVASYMGLPESVHLPTTSLRWNNGRGKCGMSGGLHPPTGGLGGALMCAASNAIFG